MIDSPFFVVGIGASAGGLEALEQFFCNTPVNTGLAFVVVQHLSPDFKSLMDELLARYTSMKIRRVEDEMPIEPNVVYLIPPRKNLLVAGSKLQLTDQDPTGGLNLPIDIFFHSLARELGKKAIAVVLSGTGTDGSRGIVDIHKAGGLVTVQSMETAAFDGMPRNAIATSKVDVIASAAELPAHIITFVSDPDHFPRGDPSRGKESVSHDILGIFKMFRSRYNLDFSNYKSATITRRLDRRVTLLGCRDVEEYVSRLENDPAECDALYRDLLIEVTHFFRDPEAFERLRTTVIPEIVKRTGGTGDLRLWSAACATGEEAYTLAMIVHDAIAGRYPDLDFKVFATDVHPLSLETASAGVYSEEAVTNVPAEFRKRYFTTSGGLCYVAKQIRSRVIFAPHDLTKDPPFTKMDLIACRNMLIYLEPPSQHRILSLFHFGLKVDGVMFLGPSESVGDLSREFANIDPHWKIYRKLRDVRLPEVGSMRTSTPLNTTVRLPTSVISNATRPDKGWLIPEVYEDLLARFVPPSLLVNQHFELIHSFGDARKILVQPPGRPTLDILRLTEGNLRVALSAALHRASTLGEQVIFQGVSTQTDSESRTYRVSVEPYAKGSERMYLICLEEQTRMQAKEPEAQNFDTHDENVVQMATLERELLYTKESLQATIEELETSNEELQATNEELVAANEELQSTNEELHSVNEELYTVNSEHQRKIDELTELTNDMDNLLKSTEIGTIFLDRDLRIRKFTPAIADAFNVMSQDIGRPVSHIAYHFDNPDLLEDVRKVIETGTALEREVRNSSDHPYLNRLRPYRDNTGQITGAVITFVDVQGIHEAEAARVAVEQRLKVITDNIPVMIGYVDREFRYRFTNLAYRQRFGRTQREMDGIHMRELLGRKSFERSQPFFARVFEGENVTFEYRAFDSKGSAFWAQVNALPDRNDAGDIVGAYVSVVDTTDRKRTEERMTHLAAIVDSAGVSVIGLRLDGIITSWNRAAEALYGYDADEIVGESIQHLVPQELHAEVQEILIQARQGEHVHLAHTERMRKDGKRIAVELTVSPIRDAFGEVVGVSKIARDISHVLSEQELLRKSVEAAPNAMILVDENGHIALANAMSEQYFGYRRSDIIGMPVEMLIPEQFRAQHVADRKGFFGAPSQRVMGAGRNLFGRHKSGDEFPVEIGLNPISTDSGQFVLAAIVDISARQQEYRILTQVVEAAPNAMILVDDQGQMVLANAKAEQYFGYTREELIGQPVELLLPERLREIHVAERQTYLKEPTQREMGKGRELFGRHKDGHEFPVEIGLNPIVTKQGTFVLSAIVDRTLSANQP